MVRAGLLWRTAITHNVVVLLRARGGGGTDIASSIIRTAAAMLVVLRYDRSGNNRIRACVPALRRDDTADAAADDRAMMMEDRPTDADARSVRFLLHDPSTNERTTCPIHRQTRRR